MTNWPKDTTAAKNLFYGDFNAKGWASLYLVRIQPPFDMFYERQKMPHGVLVNKNCAASMLDAFHEIWDKCEHDQSMVNKTGASDYGGCFNIRPIAGSNPPRWSNHSWAAAIDLSPGSNGFNMKATISKIVVDAFKSRGWRWGGDYHGRTDPMHFEAVSPA